MWSSFLYNWIGYIKVNKNYSPKMKSYFTNKKSSIIIIENIKKYV